MNINFKIFSKTPQGGWTQAYRLGSRRCDYYTASPVLIYAVKHLLQTLNSNLKSALHYIALKFIPVKINYSFRVKKEKAIGEILLN